MQTSAIEASPPGLTPEIRPTDPVFPSIGPAFDAALMRTLLQAVLPASSIDACEIDEIIYAPRKRCILSYRLSVRDAGAAMPRVQWCCVQARPHTETAAPETATAEHRFELPALDAFGWLFPHDPAMPGLPAMLDEPRLRRLLPARLVVLAARPDLVLHEIDTQIVHYLPTRSCMIRYRLGLLDPRSGERSERVIYGKVYAEHDGSAVYDTMLQLSAPGSGVRTATPLGIDRALRAVWQSRLPGEPADLRRTPADQLASALESCARCLAAFHLSTLVLGRSFETAEILSRLKTTVKAVAASLPACAALVRELVELLLRHAATADDSLPVTPIHRDLKLANFLVEGGQAALIDLDGVRLGNPSSDLGSFIASLASKALQVGWDAGRGSIAWSTSSSTPTQWKCPGPCADLRSTGTSRPRCCTRARAAVCASGIPESCWPYRATSSWRNVMRGAWTLAQPAPTPACLQPRAFRRSCPKNHAHAVSPRSITSCWRIRASSRSALHTACRLAARSRCSRSGSAGGAR